MKLTTLLLNSLSNHISETINGRLMLKLDDTGTSSIFLGFIGFEEKYTILLFLNNKEVKEVEIYDSTLTEITFDTPQRGNIYIDLISSDKNSLLGLDVSGETIIDISSCEFSSSITDYNFTATGLTKLELDNVNYVPESIITLTLLDCRYFTNIYNVDFLSPEAQTINLYGTAIDIEHKYEVLFSLFEGSPTYFSQLIIKVSQSFIDNITHELNELLNNLNIYLESYTDITEK
ncbi:MAG: hypothetical protein ACI392_06650 [Paludibacteraceae bacterium]